MATVLLLEDHADALSAITAMLRHKGYATLIAKSDEEAVEICQSYSEAIDLLVATVDPIGARGDRVAAQVSRFHPNVAVLLVPPMPVEELIVRNAIEPKSLLSLRCGVLEKPFSAGQFLEKVAEMIARRAAANA